MEELDPSELARALEEGRRCWPFVEVAPDVLGRWIGARRDLGRGGPASPLRYADLYLACACAAHDPQALRYFEEAMLAPAEPALRRLGMSEDTIQETKQVLRRHFFVGDEGVPPRIGDYSGCGELRSWVRVAAVRAALRVVRQPKAHAELDVDVLRGVSSPLDDPELDYLKRTYAGIFERALREVYAELPPRHRNVLRYHYGERLSVDAIGALYGTHRATAARWVRLAIDVLVEGTRRTVMERAGVSESEESSILRLMRMIRSQLEPVLTAVIVDEMR